MAPIEAALGYRFRDPNLLREALTHRSAVQRPAQGRRGKGGRTPPGSSLGSNERLEFIGDRVLGLLMAEWLIRRFPDEQEGKLGPRLAHLVSRTVLAELAVEIGIREALDVAAHEERAGVKQMANVLADAVEALLGATYLDGGLDPARRFVHRVWDRVMAAQVEPPKDPKTALQEWLLGRGQPLPAYAVELAEGPSHAPRFVIRVDGGGRSGHGEAGSKRAAESAAAAQLLALLSGRHAP
ncbi:ribonuclease III [Rhizosaccharibacter radicis]|uniref:Ribonuclease 3 n=1 Tax=Rhizosaccharibacter radicis TaxID=2782605 RepID=A0ABT1VV93_9PROT|nr:ribonuclease III [Acetobacteraceae bacterium KSS12]